MPPATVVETNPSAASRSASFSPSVTKIVVCSASATSHPARIIAGGSSVLTPEEQRRRLDAAWERIPGSAHRLIVLEVIDANGQSQTFSLGAHPPQLTDEDIALLHHLWLEVLRAKQADETTVHHRDLVVAGLRLLEKELRGPQRVATLESIRAQQQKQQLSSLPPAQRQHRRKRKD